MINEGIGPRPPKAPETPRDTGGPRPLRVAVVLLLRLIIHYETRIAESGITPISFKAPELTETWTSSQVERHDNDRLSTYSMNSVFVALLFE